MAALSARQHLPYASFRHRLGKPTSSPSSRSSHQPTLEMMSNQGHPCRQ
ncbi:hypothetical protein M6B38_107270 [Iris pallida]|uniref:Uncharacterized protein n=1 Tax=Iris pallida TaxID=29817 RepID=A0AAX6EG88_IRIPA|nr:hypothetical protein M6B38_107270 [Iris pallida]